MRLCHLRTKLGKLAMMYLCVGGTDLNHLSLSTIFILYFGGVPMCGICFIFFCILLQHIPPTTSPFQPTRN